MRYTETHIAGLWIIEPDLFTDERGYFFQSFRNAELSSHIAYFPIIQENESKSKKGVIRGLHLQMGEFSQGKLARCVHGALVDVAVDLRFGSPTFGQHVAIELSEDNHRQFLIPRGFAHGVMALTEGAILQYKVDNPYYPQSECCIRFDDPDLNIDWGSWGINVEDFIVSPKDLGAISLREFIAKYER